jgi:hypothetical protein
MDDGTVLLIELGITLLLLFAVFFICTTLSSIERTLKRHETHLSNLSAAANSGNYHLHAISNSTADVARVFNEHGVKIQ